MSSRLLAAIEADLAAASEDESSARARTRLAIYWARHGRFGEAESEVATLRQLAHGSRVGHFLAGANLAEGVISSYLGRGDVALDKLRRAYVMAGATPSNWHGRLALAWQAHALQHLWRSEGIPPIAALLATNVKAVEYDVASRLASVVAVGLHSADSYESARPWYECARQHAVAEGDELTIDANLHNVAAIRVQNICLDEIGGQRSRSELERARWELNSSVNFNALQRGSSFAWSLPLLSARMLMLEDQPMHALDAYQSWMSTFGAVAPKDHLALAKAEFAYCSAVSSGTDVHERVAQLLGEVPAQIGNDDLAILFYRLGRVHELRGDIQLASGLFAQAQDRRDAFRAVQRICAKSLNAVAAIPFPLHSCPDS